MIDRCDRVSVAVLVPMGTSSDAPLSITHRQLLRAQCRFYHYTSSLDQQPLCVAAAPKVGGLFKAELIEQLRLGDNCSILGGVLYGVCGFAGY